jgi:hypothetical protein
MIQLDIFEKDQMMLVLAEMKKIKDIAENSRKSLFARNHELEKRIMELEKRLPAQ